MITEYDIINLDSILVDSKQYNWFTAKLLRLMADSDMANLAKLGTVYPEVLYEFCRWKWHGVPYYFYSTDAIRLMTDYKLNMPEHLLGDRPALPWIYPTGEMVKPILMSGRDF